MSALLVRGALARQARIASEDDVVGLEPFGQPPPAGVRVLNPDRDRGAPHPMPSTAERTARLTVYFTMRLRGAVRAWVQAF